MYRDFCVILFTTLAVFIISLLCAGCLDTSGLVPSLDSAPDGFVILPTVDGSYQPSIDLTTRTDRDMATSPQEDMSRSATDSRLMDGSYEPADLAAHDASTALDLSRVDSTHPDLLPIVCGAMGDVGDSQGIGRYCSVTQECWGVPSGVCGTANNPHGRFCTYYCGGSIDCPSDTQCKCNSQTICACVPNACVAAGFIW